MERTVRPLCGRLSQQSTVNASICASRRCRNASTRKPRTVPGFLVEALRQRREAQIDAFTVLCCDNLPHNGRTVRSIVSRFAALRDRALAGYIANEVAFPSTMVDRIT